MEKLSYMLIESTDLSVFLIYVILRCKLWKTHFIWSDLYIGWLWFSWRGVCYVIKLRESPIEIECISRGLFLSWPVHCDIWQVEFKGWSAGNSEVIRISCRGFSREDFCLGVPALTVSENFLKPAPNAAFRVGESHALLVPAPSGWLCVCGMLPWAGSATGEDLYHFKGAELNPFLNT